MGRLRIPMIFIPLAHTVPAAVFIQDILLLTSASFSGEINVMESFEEAFRKGVKNPHDAAFKSAFEKRELAESFFRHYFPQQIVRQIEFRYLKFANRSYPPHFIYDLYNLGDYEDERLLLGEAMALGVVLYLMKHIFDEDFGGHLESAIKYLDKIHRQETQLEFLEWILRYAYHAREDDLGENIDRGLNALGNENARRTAMTIAEKLRQEGRQEGFHNGQSQLILKQLKKRFGYLSPALEKKLNESGVDILDRFGESIFDFESLEDAEKWWEDFEKGGNA